MEDNKLDFHIKTLQRDLLGKTDTGYDLSHYAYMLAAMESAEYYTKHLLKVKHCDHKLQLLTEVLRAAPTNGLMLEFGVGTGLTLNHIAGAKPNRKIYGFDCFTGLPETWRYGFSKGSFAQTDIPVVYDNCELVVGMFEDTLPSFLEVHKEPIAFIHIDCDLYSSTQTVLKYCAPYISKGTIIVFDEYFNYPGWQQHEFRAWQEFCDAHNIKAHPIAVVHCSSQVAFAADQAQRG